jgi:uncharacterized protein YbcI
MTASAHLLTALMPGCPGLGRRGQTQHERRDADPRPITSPEKRRALLASKRRRKRLAAVGPRARGAHIGSTSEQHSRQANAERLAVSDAHRSEPARGDPALCPLAGGRLLSEITNRIVSLMREHYGRGPIKAKTYVLDNLIVCVLTDGGLTAIERTMIGSGEPERVLEMRRDFQRMMKVRYSEMIEELTGRKVLAFLSQAHVEPDLTIEMFLMDGPLAGFGALELIDPGDG